MDKGRRSEIRDLKWRKRLKRLCISHLPIEATKSYRDHATPCSCSVCDKHKSGEEKFGHRKRMMLD